MAKDKTKKKGLNGCCISLIVITVIIIVFLAAACTVGLIYADKFLKAQFDVGVGDCWNILTGALDAKESKVVSDPVSASDEDEMYGEIKKAMFLGENADLKSVIDEAINSSFDTSETKLGYKKDSALASEDGSSDGAQATLIENITQLYSDGNLDLKRLRSYIENDVDISSVYDEEMVISISGNGFVGTIEGILNKSIASDPSTADIAGKLHIREISFGKAGENARIRIVLKLDTKDVVGAYLAKSGESVPSLAVSAINMLIPKATYLSLDLVLSAPAKLNIRINSMSDATMYSLFKLINTASGSSADIQADLDKSAEEIVSGIRNEMPALIDILGGVSADGRIKLDVYGLIADLINADKEEANKVTGRELVSLLVGVLGSDEEIAIKEKIALDSRYGEENWQSKYATELVGTMAESFALAENYFVNGLDENGNKILSVENGVIIGSDKIIGRVYEGADGTLYYKRSGGRFKLYVSGNEVSEYYRPDFEEIRSLGLHYTSVGDDYTLYQNLAKTKIYGVCGNKLQIKNGEYVELTVLYADEEGNVYSSSDAKPGLIEITKEKLGIDVVKNLVMSEEISVEKILDLIDFSSLRVNGTDSWNKPIKITDVQFASLLDAYITESADETLKKANPKVAFVKIDCDDRATVKLTLGMTISVGSLVEGESKQLIETLIGREVYAEITFDVTPDKEENAYERTVVRYNDLSGERTDEILATLQKLSGEVDVTGMLENAARQVRDAIKTLNENVKVEFVSGAMNVATPAEIVGAMLGEEGIDGASLASAVGLLLTSDGNAAIAAEKHLKPEFAAENWETTGVNEFVIGFCEAFIFDKSRFAAEGGTGYSLDKVMELATKNDFGINDVKTYLDYETMKTDGLSQWKENFDASDVQIAAVANYFLKDETDMAFKPEIISVHAFTEGGRDKLSVAASVKTGDIFAENAIVSRIAEVLGENIFVTLTVDVGEQDENRAATVLTFNDLDAQKTDEVFNTLQKISPDFKVEAVFGEVENAVRSWIGRIRSGMKISFGNGEIEFDAPKNLIYKSVIGAPSADFTADDFVDALSALTTSANNDYKNNGGFVASTANDAKSKEYWNNVLKEKYFIKTDINALFGSLVEGEDVYGVVMDGMEKSRFVKADGSYAHSSVADAQYKADNTKFAWLLRANSSSIASLANTDMLNNIQVYDAGVTEKSGKAYVSVTVSLLASDLIGGMGSLGDVKQIIESVLPEKVAVRFGWADGEEVRFSCLGMNDRQTALVEKLLEKLGGAKVFGSDGAIAGAASSIRAYFDDNFIVGTEGGKGYVAMPDFYELISKNVFPPKTGAENVTKEDVFALLKTLNERPESDGSFDSALVGYASNAATTNKLQTYVHDEKYVLVGAHENVSVSLVDPVAQLNATVLYSPAISGDASKILPDDLYITIDYDAHPVVSGFSVKIDGSTASAKINKGENQEAVERCFAYLDIDLQAAIANVKTQLDNYIKSYL